MNYQDRQRALMNQGGRGEWRDGEREDGGRYGDRRPIETSDGYGRAGDGRRYPTDGWYGADERWDGSPRSGARREGIEGYGRAPGDVNYGYVRTGERDFARESDRYEGRAESMRDRTERLGGFTQRASERRDGDRSAATRGAPWLYDGQAGHGRGLDGYALDGRYERQRDLGDGGFDTPGFASMRTLDDDRARWGEGRGRMHAAGKPPRGYVRSDARIEEDLCDRLAASGHDWSDLDVKVSDGEVTLSGSVRERAMKLEAEHIADGVRGVKDVTNQVRVEAAGTRTTAQDASAPANGKDAKAGKHARSH